MESKKRWRPSLTAYRALENEVSELRERLMLLEKAEGYLSEEKKELEAKYEAAMDEVSRLLGDCRAWREKYRSLCEGNGLTSNRGFWRRLFNIK